MFAFTVRVPVHVAGTVKKALSPLGPVSSLGAIHNVARFVVMAEDRTSVLESLGDQQEKSISPAYFQVKVNGRPRYSSLSHDDAERHFRYLTNQLSPRVRVDLCGPAGQLATRPS
jgi:hypothetical protein